MAYRNRDAVLAPEHVKRHNAGGGMLNPVIVVGGQVVGTWRRDLTRDTVRIELSPFGGLGARQREAVGAEARRYGEFLGLSPEVNEPG